MANIFDGLRKMDDDTLKYQIASLETITVKNIADEMGQKAKRGSIKAVNFLSGLIKNRKFDEPEVITLDERIIRAKNELDLFTREDWNGELE